MNRPRMSVEIDAEHGGRWTSLRGRTGREWLWRRHAPERTTVRPGDPFVDAGGLEECLPTIGGPPDHGDAWSRPWTPDHEGLGVVGEGYRLHRATMVDDAGVRASYRLSAAPGWRFIWAAHALIDVSTEARVIAPDGHPIFVNTEQGSTHTRWPDYVGTDLSRLGEPDGTALMIVLPGLPEFTVVDGTDRLTMRLRVEGQPCGVAMWRNLGGWPPDGPYRSIGIEPMLGRCPTLALAEDGETAVVPVGGVVEWSLTIEG
ncbi:hypothetical protein IU479_26975 [Nocardia abscessus]|uniref:hypothetical protein n=1 Tax=Nocardia abscessus TaxID=120957 RepID=UPI001893C7B9|nr:hypothetical protein [Nocardia abscessus]MBF6221744.1 hypothetical protein [Nocardia abscessus]